ncbi:hypothetical protein A3A60_04080 [Candidatus Curtissbacteria bacterium RIFCSPLOWO2_01_FULL_42_26]|uniref:Uncharacterized protein n=1 Tax=Candidatus Curtissbacteria bacterium RIFCSPLOWO2_01_FULL_42_26 TaxID=1797729 RepID=A0A1F5HYV2_9BACT|nr:MAG: hypothetical protein A3A60_04080 [Candidatus Curtissbacteria bacterium RIFCSPLOWO2_01_FULL_42_26]
MSNEILAHHNQPGVLIPQYEGRVETFRHKDKIIPIHKGKTLWHFEDDGQKYQIPVFSIWAYENHNEIARLIAAGRVCAMYMWGTYGTGVLINSPEWPTPIGKGLKALLANVKRGRPVNMPHVPFMYPDDMIDFWDTDRLHRDYRHLQWPEARHRLYESGPVHIIAPTKTKNPNIDSRMIMSKDHTTSYFYMPHPGWERVIKMLRKQVKHAIFGGGSLNIHGQVPAFKTAQLYDDFKKEPDWVSTIELVVVDEIAEMCEINRGQTQIRLPLKGSDGICQLVRKGARYHHTWSHQTGYPIKDALEGVREASSLKPYIHLNDMAIDLNVTESKRAMEQYNLLEQ